MKETQAIIMAVMIGTMTIDELVTYCRRQNPSLVRLDIVNALLPLINNGSVILTADRRLRAK